METVNKRIRKASHSGADIEVMHFNGEIKVEKKFPSTCSRTLAAIKKQICFKDITTSRYNIRSIHLDLIESSVGSLIRMPYVEGISGSQVAIYGGRKLASNIQLTLNFYLISLFSKAREVEIDGAVILEKIDEIKGKKILEELLPVFNVGCQWVTDNCPQVLNVPVGECHGDLTLSNFIITSDNCMYLFDFLDSFIETPLQDVAKIVQDMKYGWSFRHEKGSVKLKGRLFCEAAFPDYIYTLMRIYQKEIEIFNLVTILRIAPYVSAGDLGTINWFKETIDNFLRQKQ